MSSLKLTGTLYIALMSLIVESAFTDRISKLMGSVFNVSIWLPAAILKGNAGISKNPVSKTVIKIFWLRILIPASFSVSTGDIVDNFDLPGQRIPQHGKIHRMSSVAFDGQMQVDLVADQGFIGISTALTATFCARDELTPGQKHLWISLKISFRPFIK